MYKLYAVNNKKKSNIRGLWKNGGKVYSDFIHISKFKNRHSLKRGISGLFELGEKAVFYTESGKGYITSKTGKTEVLRHKHLYKRAKLRTSEVKGIIEKFGGLTIYKRKSGYNIEVYYN